jgi:hypothetical protein
MTYFSQNIIDVIKSKIMTTALGMQQAGEDDRSSQYVNRKTLRKIKCRWYNNIKTSRTNAVWGCSLISCGWRQEEPIAGTCKHGYNPWFRLRRRHQPAEWLSVSLNCVCSMQLGIALDHILSCLYIRTVLWYLRISWGANILEERKLC